MPAGVSAGRPESPGDLELPRYLCLRIAAVAHARSGGQHRARRLTPARDYAAARAASRSL